ncbi:MAG: cytochrome P450 [Alphaproteobacteria bacterium]|nr:MAG: cytochrome P450 [Alphaproteobacteria bacterium]
MAPAKMATAKDATNLDHIPGEYGLPILGKTLELLKDPKKVSDYMYKTYGPIYRSSAFFQKSVSLIGPEANEFVLMDRERNFSSKHGWSPFLDKLFPNGLMLRDFDNHKAHRRIMQVAFKTSAMKTYVSHLNSGILDSLKKWESIDDLHFYPAIKDLTLNTAASVFFGVPLGPEADKLNKAFMDSVQAAVAVIRYPLPGTKFRRGIKGREFIVNYLRDQLPQRRGSDAKDMFTVLCNATDEDGNGYTDDDIIDHMNFLMMAAHDTLTSSFTTLIYHLALNPEWQQTLRRECQNLGLGPQDDLPYEKLDDLEMIEWAFKEALRLNPPVPSIPRRTTREVVFKGVTIPANTPINISPGFTQKMEEIWTNPENFEPDRFSEQRGEDKKHRFAWIPFGGGAHMCIGLHFAYMQMKVFMYHLLTKYEFTVEDGYEAEFQIMPIPKPKDGLPISIRPLGETSPIEETA